MLVRDEIETGNLLHLKAEKLMPRQKQIYEHLRQGQLLEAMQVSKTILEEEKVPVLELQKQVTMLLDKYVTNLEQFSSDDAINRIQLEINDSKLVALAVGKLILRTQHKERKA